MANTYSQIYIQVIFAVRGRQSLIKKNWNEELYKYITGIVKNNKQKLIAINGVENHVHLFIGLKPDISLSDLIRDVKANSSKFINDRKLVKGKFNWQEGFGAFSYSHSHIDKVYKYIMNQEEHHKKKTFREEYTELLKKFQIEYDEKYIFEDVK